MSDKAKIIPQGDPTLPPPGDERREVLKQRQDRLEEKIEGMGIEGGTVSPSSLKIENEIAQHFNELQVPNADPNYTYRWVNADIRRIWGNRFVVQAKAEGWEVVHHEDADAKGLEHSRYVDGSIVIGDVILMRMRRERAEAIQAAREAHQQRIQTGVMSDLQEMGDKYAKYGVTVHTDMGANPQLLRAMATRAQARQIATQQFDGMLRAGTVPGAPTGR